MVGQNQKGMPVEQMKLNSRISLFKFFTRFMRNVECHVHRAQGRQHIWYIFSVISAAMHFRLEYQSDAAGLESGMN